MSEPTIDEMLAWLDMVWIDGDATTVKAIRAILEHHRLSADVQALFFSKRMELEAIRAFVERVMGKVSAQYGRVKDPQFGEILMSAIRDEVIVMETEIEAKS